MTKEQINKLLSNGLFPGCQGRPELIETHISWVVLFDNYVFKIKKPIQYSFLDFSTKEKRRYYCEREVLLNKRLTEDIYLDVQAITENSNGVIMDGKDGEIIDYAVRMRKVERERQMDILLQKGNISMQEIRKLAEKIASFHNKTEIIYNKDFLDIRNNFNDLGNEKDYLKEYLNTDAFSIITQAVEASDIFLDKNKTLLSSRLQSGFFRDCHGDLHSRNIFLLATPQPFDCIEFNDDFRQIDVLNEVAFLCMDLDAFNRKDLSDGFIDYYNSLFRSINTKEERLLFVYYKSYRANIRAKVNSLRARNTNDAMQKKTALAEADKYLQIMHGYIKEIQ